METLNYNPAIAEARTAYREALKQARETVRKDPELCIREIKREITERGGTYPGLIAKGFPVEDAARQTAILYHAIHLIEAYRAITSMEGPHAT